MKMKDMTFSEALGLIKAGCRLTRAGWNGKDMFLFKVNGSLNLTVDREPLLSILGEGAKFNYQPHIDIRTADGTIAPWVASQADMFAEDWMVVTK